MRSRLSGDQRRVDLECTVHPEGSAVARQETSLVLSGSGADKRVIDGPAGNVELRELLPESLRRPLVEEAARGKIMEEETHYVRGRPPDWRRQTCQHRERLEPGVTREPRTQATNGLERRGMALVIRDSEGDGDARIEENFLGPLSAGRHGEARESRRRPARRHRLG